MSTPNPMKGPALAAWQIYRDLGPERSLAAAAQRCTKHVSILRRWSTKYGWVGLAAAHDRAIAEENAQRDREAKLKDLARRREQRLTIVTALRTKGVEALKELTVPMILERPELLIKLFHFVDQTERLDSGEATSRQEVAMALTPEQLAALTDEELEAHYTRLRGALPR